MRYVRLLGCGGAVALALAGCAPQGTPAGAAISGGVARLAPDDAGDPLVHHEYVLDQAGARSVFVWIPRFEAFQLLKPDAAGHAGKPRGYWVKDRPAGSEGADWIRQEFGGFYAAKYEASRGPDGRAASVRGAAPWSGATWPEARAASEAVLPGRSHLLRGEEWTALAVWAFTRGQQVKGNTWFGHAADDPEIRWEGGGAGAPSLTGTGSRADWAPGHNATSHTGGSDGVFDLVGNVQEWDGSLAMRGYDLEVDGVSTGLGGTLPGYVATLHTDPVLRTLGVAGTTQTQPGTALSADFYADFFHGGGLAGGHGVAPAASEPQLFRAARGGSFEKGHHDEPAQAGMWLLCLNRTDDFRADWMGFRPALSF
ncbi:MAG: hypothetical protein FJZ01_11340 [Candidatus Sericytochromatia bacterium]|nr:hypothetical protein [Candidatus Tanganyikabacteria bacterium]